MICSDENNYPNTKVINMLKKSVSYAGSAALVLLLAACASQQPAPVVVGTQSGGSTALPLTILTVQRLTIPTPAQQQMLHTLRRQVHLLQHTTAAAPALTRLLMRLLILMQRHILLFVVIPFTTSPNATTLPKTICVHGITWPTTPSALVKPCA